MGRACASLVNEFPGRKERVLLLHGHVPFEGKSGIRDHRIDYTSLNGHAGVPEDCFWDRGSRCYLRATSKRSKTPQARQAQQLRTTTSWTRRSWAKDPMDPSARRTTSPPRQGMAMSQPFPRGLQWDGATWQRGTGHPCCEDHLQVSDEEFGALQAGNRVVLRIWF